MRIRDMGYPYLSCSFIGRKTVIALPHAVHKHPSDDKIYQAERKRYDVNICLLDGSASGLPDYVSGKISYKEKSGHVHYDDDHVGDVKHENDDHRNDDNAQKAENTQECVIFNIGEYTGLTDLACKIYCA